MKQRFCQLFDLLEKRGENGAYDPLFDHAGEGTCGAHGDAERFVFTLAEVATNGDRQPFLVHAASGYRAVGTGHHAHPAPHAPRVVMADDTAFGIHRDASVHAGFQAFRFFALTADPLPFEPLDRVLPYNDARAPRGARPPSPDRASRSAEIASRAKIGIGVNPSIFHPGPPSRAPR